MKTWRLAGALMVGCLLAFASAAGARDDAAIFRVFLKDGSSLVSFGEFALVGDRVVFSMPTAAGASASLQLVNISADRVDWPRTERYATSVRASHYIETQAEADYAAMSNEVLQTLNDVLRGEDPAARLATVERARKKLAEWPKSHYNYRDGEVRQLLGMLDEAIADLRAANGESKFTVDLVAFSAPPPIEAMLPAPTAREAIEQVLAAARASDVPADRAALLRSAMDSLDRGGAAIDAEWASTTRASVAAELEAELRLDRSYQSLTERMLRLADDRAAMGDVRGVQRVMTQIHERDAALGGGRPDAVSALVAAVQEKLDAARRLRLALDRWALRAPILARYRVAIGPPMTLFARLQPSLEDIRSLAGSSPAALSSVERLVDEIVRNAATISPPEEFASAQALLVSAAYMARNAAQIRRDATLSNNISRAWDASAAATGALMLGERARTEIQTLLRPPRLR